MVNLGIFPNSNMNLKLNLEQRFLSLGTIDILGPDNSLYMWVSCAL